MSHIGDVVNALRVFNTVVAFGLIVLVARRARKGKPALERPSDGRALLGVVALTLLGMGYASAEQVAQGAQEGVRAPVTTGVLVVAGMLLLGLVRRR